MCKIAENGTFLQFAKNRLIARVSHIQQNSAQNSHFGPFLTILDLFCHLILTLSGRMCRKMRGHSLLASRNAVLSFRQHLESPIDSNSSWTPVQAMNSWMQIGNQSEP